MIQVRFVHCYYEDLVTVCVKRRDYVDRSRHHPAQKECRWKWLIIAIILNQFAREEYLKSVGSSDVPLRHAFEGMTLPFYAKIAERGPHSVYINTLLHLRSCLP